MILTLLLVLTAAAGYQVYAFQQRRMVLARDLAVVDRKLEDLRRENEKLRADIVYSSHPENLRNEARSRFNYVAPGEKMFIIIPKQ